MRLLLILLIVLALLPLSDAIKCYETKDGKEEKEDCGEGSQFCLTKGKEKKCGKRTCNEIREGCRDGKCCCKGDFCNPAPRPTALLSLAAVAAVIGARV